MDSVTFERRTARGSVVSGEVRRAAARGDTNCLWGRDRSTSLARVSGALAALFPQFERLQHQDDVNEHRDNDQRR